MTSWLVVGSGYVGTALTLRLRASGAHVTTTRRSAGGDLAYDLAAPPPAALTSLAADIVVCTAPPGADPDAELRHLCSIPCRKLVYLSSTGVYAPGGGAIVDHTALPFGSAAVRGPAPDVNHAALPFGSAAVRGQAPDVDEHWPLAPTTASGRARLAAESALAVHARTPWLALRAAGIYGPGRGLVDRLRAGTYRIIGDGSGCVARIHVEDLVSAIVRAAVTDVTGPVNAADDAPDPIGLVADTLAAALGLPAPPRIPAAEVDPEIAGMLTADRRVSNRRLRDELGVVLRYPSWRSALPAAAPP